MEAEQRPAPERAAASEPATSFTAETTRDSRAAEELFRRVYADGEMCGDGGPIPKDARAHEPAVSASSSSREPAGVFKSVPANPSCAAQALVQALQLSYQIVRWQLLGGVSHHRMKAVFFQHCVQMRFGYVRYLVCSCMSFVSGCILCVLSLSATSTACMHLCGQ